MSELPDADMRVSDPKTPPILTPHPSPDVADLGRQVEGLKTDLEKLKRNRLAKIGAGFAVFATVISVVMAASRYTILYSRDHKLQC